MCIVWVWAQSVEAYAELGRAIEAPRSPCPSCGRPLAFSSGYWRFVRLAQREARIWLLRARCERCGVSHALLPSFLYRQRLDPATVIGATVARVVAGAVGTRRAAEDAGLPHSTVRDWCRRFRDRAALLAVGLTALVVEYGGDLPSPPAPSGEGAVLQAVGALARRLSPVVGGGAVGPWELAGLVGGGDLLGTATSPHWASLGARPFIAPRLSAPTEEQSRGP